MPFPLSPQSIDAIADVITGGSGNSSQPPIGIYRSGPAMEKFMRSCNVDFKVVGSRVPSLVDELSKLNRTDPETLSRIIEAAADPRDFIHDADRHTKVVSHLSSALAFDGYELQNDGRRIRLVQLGDTHPVVERLGSLVDVINFDTVRRDLDRASASAKSDPEDAVTAACSALESVCRSILIELGEPLPAKKDVKGLFNAVKRPLALSPDRTDLDANVAEDVRTILGGLATIVEGVGALRTHAGDAHGRERGYARIDERIARLAVHASSTATLFLIETWQRKHPARQIPRR